MSALASAATTFSWPGFFVNAAAIGATIISLGALITVTETLLRRWPRFRRWALSAPLRVTTARGRRARGEGVRADDLVVLAEEFGSVQHFRDLMIRLLFRGEDSPAAGFLLAELLAEPPVSPGQQAGEQQAREQQAREQQAREQQAGEQQAAPGLPTVQGEHHWTRLAPVLLRVFTVAARQRSTRLFARILYAEDVRMYSALFGSLAEALRQLAVSAPVAFSRYRPAVGEGPDEAGGRDGFASFMTAFAGSMVLADAVEARSRCAEQVLMWHSRRFHRDVGHAQVNTSADYLSWRYEDTHRDGVGCTHWGGERPRRLGDFDQRVLHLRSVALAEATAENGLSIVLETSETCYGITEDGAGGMGCKNVPVRLAGDDPDDPVFYRRSFREARSGSQSDPADYRVARQSPDIGRVTLLTAQLALVSADDKLILQDRSGGVRHDASLIGTSAGGVISLGGIIPSGDLDSTGWPDPTAAVAREAHEETGVVLATGSCRPLCVYQLNVRDSAGRADHLAPGGQLGAAILYLARTSLDSGQIVMSAKVDSDQARGTFEHAGLAFCPLDSAASAAAWIAAHATRLTAHGLMACAYTCVVTFGRQETETALGEAFADDPWWAVSAQAPPVPRVVRDPRQLMQGGCIDQIGPPAWAAAWRRLSTEQGVGVSG